MDCSTLHLCSADSPGLFLFTPNSLLLENTLITDLQQITRNGQQSITCGGGQVRIFREESVDQVVGRGRISQQQLHTNGHYYCLGHSMKRIHFNIFTNNFSESITHVGNAKVYIHVLKVKHIHLSTVALPTPIIHTSAGEWTFTSPDGSQVERDIVEFECRVRNITFVGKYTNGSANGGGTGNVATNELCFGGLGQLYRVKVWAVSGHNISQQPAVRCLTTDGQCREGRGGMKII